MKGQVHMAGEWPSQVPPPPPGLLPELRRAGPSAVSGLTEPRSMFSLDLCSAQV